MSDSVDSTPSMLPPTFKADSNSSRFKLITLIAFGLLLVGVFSVVIIVPGFSGKQSDDGQDKSGTEPILPETPVDQSPASSALEAQQALMKVLKLQARLENEGVKIWGVEHLTTSYEQVLTLLSEANTCLDSQIFDKALKMYQEAFVKLDQLDASRPKRILRSLKAGDEAFSRGDSKLAMRQYEVALAIDSANSKAQIGLQRAKNLPQVLEYIALGQNHEHNGNFDLAKQMYNNAKSLDKDCQSAHDHLKKINALILDHDLRRAISDVISALNQDEIEQAKRAMIAVRNLQPDAIGIRDLEQQIKNTEQRIELQRLGKQGLQHELAEEWGLAAKIYDSALAMDANVGFAQQGKLRVEMAITFNQRVQHYLSKPEELQSPEHMKYARTVYEMAILKGDIGPKFRENTKKLNQLLEKYSRPVQVIIQSDGLTDIRIYRVRQLGKFHKFSLKVRPGRFKVLGVRSGYRDVSSWLDVPAGVTNEVTLTIFCKDKV